MTIIEYLNWRQEFLLNTKGKLLDTPRGPCIVGCDVVIEDKCIPPFHIKNRGLENAEFNLIYHSIDMTPEWKDKLYGDDEPLYQAYKSLNIATLITNGKRRLSRKNIIFNKECCLCYWQLHDDTLIVISRSLDVQRAGLSDLAIVSRAGFELGCSQFKLITLNNHIYLDREHIARRKDENTSI